MGLGEIWWLDAERFSQVKSYEKAAGGDIKIFCGWKHENILVLEGNIYSRGWSFQKWYAQKTAATRGDKPDTSSEKSEGYGK